MRLLVSNEVTDTTTLLAVTDLAERAELALQGGGTTEVEIGADPIVSLADPPVTLVWEPETP